MRDEPCRGKRGAEGLEVAEDVIAVPVRLITVDTGLSVTWRRPARMASPPRFDRPVSMTMTSRSPTMKDELPIAGNAGGVVQVSV